MQKLFFSAAAVACTAFFVLSAFAQDREKAFPEPVEKWLANLKRDRQEWESHMAAENPQFRHLPQRVKDQAWEEQKRHSQWWRELNNPDAPFVPMLREPLRRGVIGMTHGGEVIQVVDKETVLLSLDYCSADRNEGTYPKAQSTVLLKGYSTEDLADGDRITIKDPLEVVGTVQYENLLGAARTVYEVRPFDMTPIHRWLEEQAFRVWTDNTGQYKTEAKFVRLQRGMVTLAKRDGAKATLPLARLSAEDQEFVRELLKKRAESRSR